MISDKAFPTRLMVPFVFHFAQQLPEVIRYPLRYDATRQVAQVLFEGKWLDRTDVPGDSVASTRFTRVQAETTDDQ